MRRINLRQWLTWRKCRVFKLAILFSSGVLASWLLIISLKLYANASQPVDAFFVLGGSIRREIYVAHLAKQQSQIPILISTGSQEPCIWLIFQREKAPKEKVWLENCANSTFDNFYFGVPILEQWGVNKVRLITSPTHLPRAKWLAQIFFGARSIWVEIETVKEEGTPGNQESTLKTALDVTRSLFWALLSQIVQPQCSKVTKLVDVDIKAWQDSGFKCERQGGLDRFIPKLVN
ncbi:MAG: YdcF family protein [Prochloraceae cyanobacterium]|nr:YdcF family protein [Prochloraceae cyanobacterium]